MRPAAALAAAEVAVVELEQRHAAAVVARRDAAPLAVVRVLRRPAWPRPWNCRRRR
jgi:hypothetical protein